MKKDDEILNIPEQNNDEPADFNEAVGKFIQKAAELVKNADDCPPIPPIGEYHLEAHQLVTDLGLLADGIFDGELEYGENYLRVSFSNGQIFRFTVEEETPATT